MTKTTRKSAHAVHLAYMLTLALTTLTPYTPSPNQIAIDQRLGQEAAALAQQIAARYEGDHTAWLQIRANILAALALFGRFAAVEGFDAVEDDFVTLRETARAYLVGLTHEQRVQLAAYEAFRHAHLVEESDDQDRDPALVVVLNPVYSPDSPVKQRIQDKADERFAERYGALNLASLVA
ncbi:hypothetical protein [Nonomuraea glycinis]|uniref:hypothetical protein n=1 Tax=Nonomuraea glycinis TaxID=2047744 RepID=UPI0033BA1387